MLVAWANHSPPTYSKPRLAGTAPLGKGRALVVEYMHADTEMPGYLLIPLRTDGGAAEPYGVAPAAMGAGVSKAELADRLSREQLDDVSRAADVSNGHTGIGRVSWVRANFSVVIEPSNDDDALSHLPDDPAALKAVIAAVKRQREDEVAELQSRQRRITELEEQTRRLETQRQELEVQKLRLEVELLRLKKWYYGPRADTLANRGDLAQMLLEFATDLEARPVDPANLPCTDDTVMPMLAPDKTVKARMWVYLGDESNPYNVFDFTTGRGRDGPIAFLKDFNQTLLADAYGGYDGVAVASGLTRAGCWAHARRKFVDAEKAHPQIAAEAVAVIKRLYAIEERGKALGDEDRRALRQRESAPVLRCSRTSSTAGVTRCCPSTRSARRSSTP